jgi:6-phosphogluconolactonase (cycloisomerase 2 family)
MQPNNLTRRALFGQVCCGSYVLTRAGAASKFEYEGGTDRIEVYRRQGASSAKIQTVMSANPSFLALDQVRLRLFAVNEIDEFEGLPRGSVESYTVAPGTGLLTLISREPLSLSATRPRSLAISPDGRFIVVAVYGGGAYNVLPLGVDGRIGRVTQVIKEIGCGPDRKMQATAHPHSVVFHPSGKFVVTTDFGCDRINVFSFNAGGMTKIHQIAAPAGSGPAEVYLDDSGLEALVQHRLGSFQAQYKIEASA